MAQLGPEDVLTLIYTSGTTGPPKGVMLTHRNLMAAVNTVEAMIQFPRGGRVISWLPNAHVAERNAHHYLPVVYGLQVTCCPNPREVLQYLPEVQPSWFFAVPRIWEKLKAGLETMLAAQPDEQRLPVQAALEASLSKVRLEQAGEPVPADLAAQVAEADATVFAGLRRMLGFDAIAAVNVGAAPTPVEVIEFFHALGVPLAELWGMSETCGAGACNPPDRVKIGTVGPASPGTEARLAEDGELLVRSDVYARLPRPAGEDRRGHRRRRLAAHRRHRRDRRRRLHPDRRPQEGAHHQRGRQEHVACEHRGDAQGRLAAHRPGLRHRRRAALQHGARRAGPRLRARLGPAAGDRRAPPEALAADERVRAAVQEGVDAANAKLSRVEQLKRFHLVPGDWVPGGDELTPTMKLKRKPIAAKYAAEIDALYAR